MLLYTQLCLQCSALALVYLDRMRRQCFILSFFLIFSVCPITKSALSLSLFHQTHSIAIIFYSFSFFLAILGLPPLASPFIGRDCTAESAMQTERDVKKSIMLRCSLDCAPGIYLYSCVTLCLLCFCTH